MSKKEIVEILMRRDNLTKEDAISRVQETQNLINEYIENGMESPLEGYYDVEDILATELGLELDYIFDFLL